MMIRKKAKYLFLDLKSEYCEESTVGLFAAREVWFHRFKQSCNFLNNMTGEPASTDQGGAVLLVSSQRI
jgi:hypothetical protein